MLGGVRRFKVAAEKSLEPAAHYGESSQHSRVGEKQYSIHIERALSLQEEGDLFSLQDFLLTVVEENRTWAYKHCQWVKLEEVYDYREGKMQNMVLISLRRVALKGGWLTDFLTDVKALGGEGQTITTLF